MGLIKKILKEAYWINKAVVFDTKEQYDKYMKDHPEANPNNHSIKKDVDKHDDLHKKIKDKQLSFSQKKVNDLNNRLKKWGWSEDSKAYQAVNYPKNYLDSLLGEHEIIEAQKIDELGYKEAHELSNREQLKSIKESGLLQGDYPDKIILKGLTHIFDELHPIGNSAIDDRKSKPSGIVKKVFDDLLAGLYQPPTYTSLHDFYKQ